MHLAVLFTFSFCGLAALIVHSYFTKGRRLTLTFFLFAFIAGMRKEAGSFLEQTVSLLDRAPFVHSNRYPETFCVVNTVTGWALAFYLSWYLAEKITDRFVWLRKRIFPTLLVAAVAVAALAYAVEATAVNIGWWKWRFFDDKFSGFLVGGVHFFALNAWLYFAFHFLAPYFLIECSGLRKRGWKCVFFLIPLSRTWTIVFLGSYAALAFHDAVISLLFLGALVFFPLPFDFPPAGTERKNLPASYARLIGRIPMAVSIMVLAVLFYFDVFRIGKPVLALSLLPFFALLALSSERISWVWLFVFLSALPVFFGRHLVPALVPALAVLLLQLPAVVFASVYPPLRAGGKKAKITG